MAKVKYTGADLRALRLSTGMSIKKVTDISGVNYGTWQRWETAEDSVPFISFAISWLNQYIEIANMKACQCGDNKCGGK